MSAISPLNDLRKAIIRQAYSAGIDLCDSEFERLIIERIIKPEGKTRRMRDTDDEVAKCQELYIRYSELLAIDRKLRLCADLSANLGGPAITNDDKTDGLDNPVQIKKELESWGHTPSFKIN